MVALPFYKPKKYSNAVEANASFLVKHLFYSA